MEGKDALFRSKEAKEGIVNYFIETYMKLNPEDKDSQLAKDLRDIIAQDLDPEDLFYFIGPALSDMILQVPAHSYPTQKITDDLFELFLREPPEYLYKRYQDFFDLARSGDRKALMQAFPGTVKILKLRLKSYVTGKMPILKYDQNHRLTVEEPKKINYTNFEDSALEMLQPYIEQHTTFQKQVTPVELSVEVAKKTGGLAVRLLQLFGMFFKLSSDDRLTLSQVYDDVEGQNKLQFYEQLKRYAAINPKFKAIFEKIKEIRDMLGGGSIVTVYEVIDKNGNSEAVGVNNPNVEFRAGEFKRFGDSIIGGLVTRNPDNRGLPGS